MRDSSDFDRFYEETSQRVLRYGYALTGDLAEAQDLTQEAYIRAWQRWGKLAGYDSAEAWVRLVLARLATDRWRRLRSRRKALQLAGPPDPARPPSEDTVLLVRALRLLPARQRQVIALHYICDMSVAGIAVEIGAAAGSVKVWLSRGRAALAAQLDDSTTEAHHA